MIHSWIAALKLDELQHNVRCATNQQIFVSQQASSIRLCSCREEWLCISVVLRRGCAPLGPHGKAQPFLTTGGEADANDNMNLIAVLRRWMNDV